MTNNQRILNQTKTERAGGREKKGSERMWESIILTVAATAGNNIGKILQKKGTVILPPLSFKFKACLSFFNSAFCPPPPQSTLAHDLLSVQNITFFKITIMIPNTCMRIYLLSIRLYSKLAISMVGLFGMVKLGSCMCIYV